MKNMKFNKISTKMLTVLLSVSLLSLILLLTVSYSSSKTVIENQILKNMHSELKAQVNEILSRTNEIKVMSSQIARNVEASYKTTSLKQYEQMLKKTIFDNGLIYGSGIWFEPYVYDDKEKYVGPYVYKDNNSAIVTYDYSNEDYDYLSYEWYHNAMGGTKNPIFSQLYYDDILGVTMATCTVPMYNSDEKLIGAVTVDMDISSIQDLINGFKVGKAGKITLLTNNGLYITNADLAKVMKGYITEEDNQSIAAMGEKLLSSDSGIGEFTNDGTVYSTYYSSIENLNWKIMIQIPQSEINEPLNELLLKLIIISIISLLLLFLVILIEVRNLTNNIKKVQNFALLLANGDFTTEGIEIKSRDEFGQTGQALNHMLIQNKGVIQTIAQESKEINKVSLELEETTTNLKVNFDCIEAAINGISENMMSSSAATEEVNASVEEVNASINFLVQETSMSYEMAQTIKKKAEDVQKKSAKSYEMAMDITIAKEEKLHQSMEAAKVVETIGFMVATISQIAEQVNLLSLNASIEAARAGEQGRGFAVVASEIGNLANQATNTVKEIAQTTEKVKASFDNLMENSMELLLFIQNIVTPDYKSFVEVGNQYELDANNIRETASKISDMTNNIDRIIKEVTQAIQGIAIEAENAAVNSTSVLDSMEEVSQEVNNIDKAVSNEKKMSDHLDQMVNKFRLE